jgi:hypothetical protein
MTRNELAPPWPEWLVAFDAAVMSSECVYLRKKSNFRNLRDTHEATVGSLVEGFRRTAATMFIDSMGFWGNTHGSRLAQFVLREVRTSEAIVRTLRNFSRGLHISRPR